MNEGGAERAQRAKRNLGLMSKMVKVGPQNSRKMVKVAAHVDRRKTVKVPTLQKPNPHPMGMAMVRGPAVEMSSSGLRNCENGDCIVGSRARYKVYTGGTDPLRQSHVLAHTRATPAFTKRHVTRQCAATIGRARAG